MPTVLLNIQNGTLPSGTCFQTEQQRLNAYAAIMQAVLNGMAFFNYGPDKPAVANQGYPWFNTTNGIWFYFSGSWISPVGPQYDLNIRREWVGSLADLTTYDGGDTDPPSDRSGAMWVEDTEAIGRSPMHPGLIPETVVKFNKTLAVGEKYGDGSHVQTTQEMAAHTHAPDPTKADGFLGHAVVGAPATFDVTGGGSIINMPVTGVAGGDGLTPSVTQGMSLVHPVIGRYSIKWTGRAYRRIA